VALEALEEIVFPSPTSSAIRNRRLLRSLLSAWKAASTVLEGFQRNTVEAAFQALSSDRSSRRFLIADEVGLEVSLVKF
jgi:hypothetical protein